MKHVLQSQSKDCTLRNSERFLGSWGQEVVKEVEIVFYQVSGCMGP